MSGAGTDAEAAAEIEDLLGAYTLHAVHEDERQRVEAYLAHHPEAQREVTRYQEVAAALAGGEAAEVPDHLWERVRTRLQPPDDPGRPSTKPVTGPAIAPLPTALPERADRSHRRGARSHSRWPLAGLAAAALALIAGTAAVTTALNNNDEGRRAPLQDLALAARDAAGSRTVQLNGSAGAAQVVIDESGNGYLLGGDLRPLPKEQTYQLWSLDADTPVSLAVLGPHPQLAVFPASGARTMALSIEPAGGRASPTLPPVATSGV